MNNWISSLYRVELYNQAGTLIDEIADKTKSLRMGFMRNRPETATLSCDLREMEARARTLGTNIGSLLEPGIANIRIKRGDNYLFGGEIQFTEGKFDDLNTTLEIRAYGWAELLKKRITSNNFSAQDTGQIAWTMISGAFGITQGTIQASRNQDKVYENAVVYDKIVQLTNEANAGDFEITYDKIFNWYYPKIGRSGIITLEFPNDIQSIGVSTDAMKLVNRVLARGQGFGSEQLTSTRNNTVSQTTYGLRQEVHDFNDAKDTTTLQNSADEHLRVFSLPLFVPQLTLRPNHPNLVIKRDYWIGDTFKIRVPESDYFTDVASSTYSIDSIDVSVNDAGLETITINQGNKTIGADQDVWSGAQAWRDRQAKRRRLASMGLPDWLIDNVFNSGLDVYMNNSKHTSTSSGSSSPFSLPQLPNGPQPRQ